MSEAVDILIAMYQEHLTQARHQESERATVTNLILVLSTVITGFITFDQIITISDVPAALLLVFLGVYGAIFSMKLYERFRLHYERSRSVRFRIEQLYPITKITELQTNADNISKNRFPFFFDFRLYKLWVGISIFITIFGMVLLFMALFLPSPSPSNKPTKDPVRIELLKSKSAVILIELNEQRK